MVKSNIFKVFGDIFADSVLDGEAIVFGEGSDDGDGGEQGGVESGVHPIFAKFTSS